MKGVLGFMGILKWLAMISLFSGLITTLVLDLIITVTNPRVGIQFLATDLAKNVFLSQNVIAESLKQFSPDNDATYNQFLFYRVIGSSLISLAILWFVYFIFSRFVPGATTDLGAKILILILTVGIIYSITLVYSWIVEEKFVPPFHGWIELVRNSGVIRNYIETSYEQKLNVFNSTNQTI